MRERLPSWGIEPVPERLRVLGFLDSGVLWSSLGASLLVLVGGTLLVPGLSFRNALFAILVGGLVGNAMLGLAGLIGADARVPAMVLLRAPLGQRGSYLATALNVVQNLGWTVFEVIVIATAASALSDRVFGFRGEWLWRLLAAGFATGLALLGPVGFVRSWLRRFALWVVLASLGYLTWWTLRGAGLGTLWSEPGDGGLSFWQGVDLVVAMPVSWLPLAADYTRFSAGGRQAFWGAGVGYLIPNMWLYGLGAILLLSRHLVDAPSVMTAVAGGGAVASLTLLALVVDETKEPFANVYSAAVSVQNLLPRVPQRLLILAAGAVCTLGVFVVNLVQYASFLFLLGSFFVPLFGVLLADWLLALARYSREDVFRSPALRAGQVFAWLAGFAVYQWLQPTGPQWWTGLVAHASAGSRIGASLPSFAAAGAIAALTGLRYRRPREATAAAAARPVAGTISR